MSENKTKLGQEPAFAQTMLTNQEQEQLKNGLLQFGMSKRFYAACFAMQGILASPNADVQLLYDNQKAEYSFKMADELLKQEIAE